MLSLSVPQPVNTTSFGRQPTTRRRRCHGPRRPPGGCAGRSGATPTGWRRARQVRHHRLDRLGAHGRRGSMVEVGDRRLRHPSTLPLATGHGPACSRDRWRSLGRCGDTTNARTATDSPMSTTSGTPTSPMSTRPSIGWSSSQARGGRVLELGVGTGRLAVPMAAAGLSRHRVDSSEAMLAKLAERDAGRRGRRVVRRHGRRAPRRAVRRGARRLQHDLQPRSTREPSSGCSAEVADRLGPGGVFVVEAFVPDAAPGRQLVDGRRPLDGGRPRRALGLEQPPRRPACRRPVRPSLRGRRCSAPAVVDPLGDACATRCDGDRCRAPSSPIGGPTWRGPPSTTTARSTSRSTRASTDADDDRSFGLGVPNGGDFADPTGWRRSPATPRRRDGTASSCGIT